MHHFRRAIPALALATALVSGTAACGASASGTSAKAGRATPKPTATASSSPLANLTADQIATKALADTEAAGSVHITGKVRYSGKTLGFDLTLVRGNGCEGGFKESAGSFKIIYLGKTVWLKASTAFYKSVGGVSSAALSLLSGKWLELTGKSSNFKSLASLCKLNKLLGSFGSAPTGLVKGPAATVNGQPAVKIMDTGDSAYMYVSDAASPELMRMVAGGSTGVNLDFTTAQAATVTITAPPASEVLNGSTYGF